MGQSPTAGGTGGAPCCRRAVGTETAAGEAKNIKYTLPCNCSKQLKGIINFIDEP